MLFFRLVHLSDLESNKSVLDHSMTRKWPLWPIRMETGLSISWRWQISNETSAQLGGTSMSCRFSYSNGGVKALPTSRIFSFAARMIHETLISCGSPSIGSSWALIDMFPLQPIDQPPHEMYRRGRFLEYWPLTSKSETVSAATLVLCA